MILPMIHRELSRRRERRSVDALRELFFAEMEVLHEIDRRQDRGAYADLGDVLFDLVLAVEVRDGCLSIGGAGREGRLINTPFYFRFPEICFVNLGVLPLARPFSRPQKRGAPSTSWCCSASFMIAVPA